MAKQYFTNILLFQANYFKNNSETRVKVRFGADARACVARGKTPADLARLRFRVRPQPHVCKEYRPIITECRAHQLGPIQLAWPGGLCSSGYI